jgi:Zn-dependent protease with chaperone function
VAATAALAVLLAGAGYLALGWVGEALGARLSPAREARLFQGLTLPDAGQVDVADPAQARLDQAWRRQIQQPGLLPLPYRLSVLPTDVPNAFALPGGGVGVTRGLLLEVTTEIGLAMVLAHELGHHHHRHTVRRLGPRAGGAVRAGGDLRR